MNLKYKSRNQVYSVSAISVSVGTALNPFGISLVWKKEINWYLHLIEDEERKYL